jgi:tetratricopeptide (TPR) repeat protein
MTLPPEIVITIENIGADEYLAKTARCDEEEICRNTFHFSSDLLVDLEPQWMLDKAVPRDFGDPTKRGPDEAAPAKSQAQQLAEYGQRLYGFLFGDGRDWDAFLRFNDEYRRQARVTLALHKNAAALWRLPWEYLNDGQDFLALHGRFLLSRLPYGLKKLDPPQVALPVRVLVVVAAPDDQVPLDTEEELGVIQAALDEAVREGCVQVEYLDDATLPAIGDALHRFRPHVWHYTGHGKYDAEAKRSFLALEDDDGRTRPAGIQELRPYLQGLPDLRLVVLSGCQTAQTSDVDAFRGVATGLLEADIPAVLAMQYSILDQSGIVLAEAFYSALAEGDTPDQAVYRARLALRDFDQGPGYDWGIPALYLRAAGMRLVDPAAAPPAALLGQRAAALDVGGLPLPPHFVGRKAELRALRRALRERDVTAAYLRGIGGMGKSSVAAKLLQRPGVAVDGALVVRCDQVAPQDIPAKLANFLAAQGKTGHAEAAALLLDSRQPPAERARRALDMLAGQRYILVFDNFESVMDVPAPERHAERSEASRLRDNETLRSAQGDTIDSAFDVADPDLRALFDGLLSAGPDWRGLCLFTGRYRWRALGDYVGRGAATEIPVNDLSARQTIMLMNNLPRLRREPLATKIALYRKVGGHPKSIELLEGWLATGRVSSLLDDSALDGLLREEWEAYFLRALFSQLSTAEREALTRLSIFRTRLDKEEFEYAGVDDATVRRWLDLSLLQRERAETADLSPQLAQMPDAERRRLMQAESYSVHPVVREYLLGQMPPVARRDLHAWAAAYQGRPFVEMARRYAAQSGQSWTDEEIEALARNSDGVVGRLVARTDDMGQARAAMGRALEWQHHLFAAEAYEAAKDIEGAVWAVLARWGERDRAKALLRGSIETLEGFDRAVAQGNLATLLKDEGKLGEALATYQEIYRAFEALGDRQEMAVALTQIASVYQNQGKYEQAIEYEERSLGLEKERGNKEGQAISLHQLSILFMLRGDYATALARSEEAAEIDRRHNDQAGLAADLHQQGLILNALAHAAQSDAERETQRRAAFERFRGSLEIKRRIGNEAGAADSLGELGKLLLDAGQLREAIAAFSEALEIYRRLGNPAKAGLILEFLGSVHERQGQYPAALEKYEQVLELKRKYMGPQNVAITEKNIARVREKMGGGG